MTIVFQGHVRALTQDAPNGKLAVTLATPMSDANGKDWVVFVPEAQAKRWLPGLTVQFTIYTLAGPESPEVVA
jgi:hypothetical protein